MGKPCGSGHVHALSGYFVNTAANDLIDRSRSKVIAGQQLHHDLTQYIGGVGATQAAIFATHWRAGCVNNNDVFHTYSPFICDYFNTGSTQ